MDPPGIFLSGEYIMEFSCLLSRLLFQDLSLINGLEKIAKCDFGTVLEVLITQYLVFLGWLIFRVEDLK